MRIIKPYFEILNPQPADWPEMAKRIERAGRTCYKSEDRITEDSCGPFIRKIIERGHESVLEHESVSVRIVCDRGVTHELVRHRLASYSQESTRYCNYGNGITVIEPCFWERESQEYNLWRLACKHAEYFYIALLKRGVTPQDARSVLPNSLKTEIVMSCNLREWRHVFRLRTSKAAHPQMREIAVPMFIAFRDLLPGLFFDIEVPDEDKFKNADRSEKISA